MKLQKIGGYGSLGSVLVTAIFLAIVLLVFPRLGLVGPSDRMDPIKGIDAGSASPLPFFLLNLDFILWAMSIIPISLALRERMQSGAPNLMGLAVIGVSIAYAFLFASGIIGIVGMPSIISAKDAAAYRSFIGVYFGLVIAGDHAVGWSLLLIGWAALKTKSLPRILSYLSILIGIIMILEFVVLPFMMLSLFLWVIWSFWLGVVLLRGKLDHAALQRPQGMVFKT
jgi:hypothetical protein